jgi:type I restriction enzyme S subunit
MAEWREVSLGEVIELKRGYDLPQRERTPGITPLISSSGLTDRHGVAMVKGPGVVTGRYGTLGKVFYISEDFWPLNTTLYVRDFKGNDPRFISYLLSSIDFLAYSDKAAVPGVNRNHLHEAKVRLPADVSEQRAIATVLSALEDKIELNQQTNETLEAMARAIFKDWFLDFGPTFTNIEGRRPYLRADLWAAFPHSVDNAGTPDSWRIGELREVVEFNPKVQLSIGAIAPYLDMAALPTSGPIPDQPVARAFTSGPRFRNGDTLLARITPCLENGKAAYIHCLPSQGIGWGSTEFVVMRTVPPVPTPYAYLIARDPGFRALAVQSMTGSSGRQRAQTDALTQHPIVIPPLPVWKIFGSIVEPLFAQIVANGNETQILAQTRDLLLPKLISGEIRLNDAEETVQEAL